MCVQLRRVLVKIFGVENKQVLKIIEFCVFVCVCLYL